MNFLEKCYRLWIPESKVYAWINGRSFPTLKAAMKATDGNEGYEIHEVTTKVVWPQEKLNGENES